MNVALKILGFALIGFGLVDLVGSFTGFDLWGDFLKISLPDIIWTYSAYIEMILGYALFHASKSIGGDSE
jgi:hypothetical protein